MQNGQKLTRNGRPIVDRSTGLPVFNKSVNRRIETIKDILYIGLDSNSRKWAEIASELK